MLVRPWFELGSVHERSCPNLDRKCNRHIRGVGPMPEEPSALTSPGRKHESVKAAAEQEVAS
jgi:hypothetical protein